MKTMAAVAVFSFVLVAAAGFVCALAMASIGDQLSTGERT